MKNEIRSAKMSTPATPALLPTARKRLRAMMTNWPLLKLAERQ